MQPLDLQEWAELAYRDGDRQLADIGCAVLELMALEPLAESYLELLEALAKVTGQAFKKGEEWRHVEWLEDRSALLEEIDTALKVAGFDQMGIDDRVTEVLAKLEDVETERDALRKEVEELKAHKLEYDL